MGVTRRLDKLGKSEIEPDCIGWTRPHDQRHLGRELLHSPLACWT